MLEQAEAESKRALEAKIEAQKRDHAAVVANRQSRDAKSQQAAFAKSRAVRADEYRVQQQELNDQDKVKFAAKRLRMMEQSTVLVSGGRVNVTVITIDGNSFSGNWQGGGKGGDGYLSGSVFTSPAKGANVPVKPSEARGSLAVQATDAPALKVIEITDTKVICEGPSKEHVSYLRSGTQAPLRLAWLMADEVYGGVAGAKASMPAPGLSRPRSNDAVRDARAAQKRPLRVSDERGNKRFRYLDHGTERAKAVDPAVVIKRVAADPACAHLAKDLEVRGSALWDVVCNEERPLDKGRVKKHLLCGKHSNAATALADADARGERLVRAHKRIMAEANAEGQSVDAGTLAFRAQAQSALMKGLGSGEMLQHFRPLMERSNKDGFKLTSATHMSALIPAIYQDVLGQLKVDGAVFHNDAFAHVTDATTLQKVEWLATVTRVCTREDLRVVEFLSSIKSFGSHVNGAMNAHAIVVVGDLLDQLPNSNLFLMADRVASNVVLIEALRDHDIKTSRRANLNAAILQMGAGGATVPVEGHSDLTNMSCLGHTASHIGEAYDVPELTTFMSNVGAMYTNSNVAQRLHREADKNGKNQINYSGARWWNS